jgi:cyclohexyl-isocyanide hydratase
MPEQPHSPRLIGMLVFPGLTQLDMTGPYEVLARLPTTTVHLVAHTLDAVRTDRGMMILPSMTYAQCPQLDVVMVPGGPGQQNLMEDEVVLDFLRAQAKAAKYVTSVCTGSLVLGAAGLLKGKRATCHWAAIDHLKALGAIPVSERVVVDGNIVTGAGVASGLDFGLALAAELEGEDVAREIQLQIEYDPAPPFASGSPRTAAPETVAKLRSRLAALNEQRRMVAERVGRKLGIISS